MFIELSTNNTLVNDAGKSLNVKLLMFIIMAHTSLSKSANNKGFRKQSFGQLRHQKININNG